jgi:hypothetical protein
MRHIADNPGLISGKRPNRRAKLGQHEWVEGPNGTWCRHSTGPLCTKLPMDLEQELAELGGFSTGEPVQMPGGKLAPPGRESHLAAGTEFDVVGSKKYPVNQLYVDAPGGRRWRLDSYDPAKNEIVSRKYTQLAQDEFSALDNLQELRLKYPPGSTIADVDSTPVALRGKKLSGSMILEVPPQQAPIPEWLLKYARETGITIRDFNGVVYK